MTVNPRGHDTLKKYDYLSKAQYAISENFKNVDQAKNSIKDIKEVLEFAGEYDSEMVRKFIEANMKLKEVAQFFSELEYEIIQRKQKLRNGIEFTFDVGETVLHENDKVKL